MTIKQKNGKKNKKVNSKKKIHNKKSIKLNKNQIKAIHTALKILAKKDPDKASVRNRKGFNAVDSHKGHFLANLKNLNYSQAVDGFWLIYKYRRQIPNYLKQIIFSNN